MILVTSNKSKQLLFVSYIGQVRLEEIQKGREDLKAQLAEMLPGFRLLADLSPLESMGLECIPELGETMELIDQSGVGVIVRVIPDPAKDIGMNILTIFHYAQRPQIVTCKNMMEAARALAL